MFSHLEKEVIEFNVNRKGSTWMQKYIASNHNNPEQPFILVVVTNLIKHCHQLQEAGELVYMDTMAGLDVLNTPLMIFSTSTPAGGLPLAAILTSNKTAATFTKALEIVKKMIPSVAFGRWGSVIGPQVFMTDDCRVEKRWLWDSKHKIHNNDHATLIEHVKKMVFSKTKIALNIAYSELIHSNVYQKYPTFQNYFKISWEHHHEWAVAFRQLLPIQQKIRKIFNSDKSDSSDDENMFTLLESSNIADSNGIDSDNNNIDDNGNNNIDDNSNNDIGDNGNNYIDDNGNNDIDDNDNNMNNDKTIEIITT
ncbi:6600_t:CDS:2 [Cetraspora pellucida]|uniref:6600_t:CDS:1 n=1 Tax=Cetraspora pellucida TaxID=1433469 RepID=A0A9N9HDV4_9GLOM|nr:6600_t:CDS:2 [Cetraspora pellucida]